MRRRSDYENGGRRSTGEAFAQRVKLIHDWDLGEKRPFYDIDTKHQKEQAFEAEIAEELFAYLREIELIKRPSDDAELQTAIPRPGFRKERMRAVNFLFSNVHALMVTVVGRDGLPRPVLCCRQRRIRSTWRCTTLTVSTRNTMARQ